MAMHPRPALFASALLALFVLASFSCVKKFPKELNGTWSAGGTLPNNDGSPGMSWFLKYVFNGNTYSMTGYPPLSEKGRMELLEQNGKEMEVKMMPEGQTPRTVRLILYTDSLALNNQVFHRSAN